MADQALQIAISLDRRQVNADIAALRQQLAAVKMNVAVTVDAKAAQNAIANLQSVLKAVKPVVVPVALDRSAIAASFNEIKASAAANKITLPVAVQTATGGAKKDNSEIAAVKAASAEKIALIKSTAAQQVNAQKAAIQQQLIAQKAASQAELAELKAKAAQRLSAQKASYQAELSNQKAALQQQLAAQKAASQAEIAEIKAKAAQAAAKQAQSKPSAKAVSAAVPTESISKYEAAVKSANGAKISNPLPPGLDAEFSKVTGEVNKYKGVIESIGAVAIGTAITAGLKTAVGDFVEFDNAVKASGVVSGSFGTPEYEKLRKETERLGIVTSKTPKAVAEMSISLSRAGFSATESAAALEGIVRASEATGESLDTVGDIIAKTVRTFSLAAGDSEKVSDLLVSTANNTNTSVSGLGESLKYVGAQAAASNQPLDDTLVLLGLLGDAGIQGSTAGTGLAAALDRLKIASAGGNTEFSNLVRGSARATEALNAIGAEVRNADGTMKSLLEILPIIKARFADLSQQDQDVLSKALFGVEGGRTIQTLLNATGDRIDLVTGKIRNSAGAARKAGEDMLQGLGGALNLIGGSIGAVSAKVGSFVAIGLEPLVRAANSTLGLFLKLPAPIQGAVVAVGGLATAFGAAVAATVAYRAAVEAKVVADTLASIATVKATAIELKGLVIKKAAVLATNTARIATIANAQANALLAGSYNAAILAQAKQAASQAVVIARQTVLNAQWYASIPALLGSAKASLLDAAAKQKAALASNQAAVANLKLLGTLALVAAAVAAVSAALNRTEGAKFAGEVNKSSEAIRKLNEEAKKPIEVKVSVNTQGGISDALSNISKNFSEAGGGLQGALAAVQSGFIETYNVIAKFIPGVDGLTDSTDRYGGSLVIAGKQLSIFGREIGVVTAAQRGAQQATLALEEQQKAVEARLTEGQDVLKKYGLLQADANDRARLSFNGLKDEAVSAIQAQIDANNKAIDAIKASKAPNAEAAALQQAQIANIERQNNLLKQRVAFLNADTDATAKNVKVGRTAEAITADIEKVTGSAVSDKALQQGELVKLQMVYDAESSAQATGDAEKDAAASQARIAEIEINAARDRIAKLEPYLKELQQAAIGDPAAQTKAENVEADLIKAKIELINKERSARKSKADEAKKAAQEEIKQQEQLIANDRARIQLNSTKAINAAKGTFLKERKVDADEASENLESARLDIESKALEQEAGLREAELALIQKQEAQKLITREEAAAKRLQIEQKAADAQGKLLDIQQQREDLALKKRLRRLEEASAKELAAAKLTTTQSSNEQKRARLAGTATDSEGAAIAAELQLSEQVLAIKKRELAEIRALEAEGLLSKKESAKRQAEISQAIADQEGQILDLQLKQREQAITKAATAAKLAIESEVQARQTVANAIQKQIDLLNAKANAQKATSEAAIAAIDNELKIAGRAAELQKTISSKDATDEEKNLARTQLTELGFSADASALDILKQQQALEDKQAAAKAAALSNELALTTQIQKITSQKAITEARIAELKAKQAAIDAAANLEKAKLSGDENAVKSAELQNKAAQQAVALAAEQVELTQNQAAAEQRAAEIRAQSLLDAAKTEELLREQAQSQALLAAGGRASDNQRSQAAGILQSASVLPPAQPPSLVPDATSLTGSLKSANSGIESKLDQLNENILTLANSPRSLTVSSPNPVQDTSKILGDLQQAKARAKGV